MLMKAITTTILLAASAGCAGQRRCWSASAMRVSE